jgi:hypothetical protein
MGRKRQNVVTDPPCFKNFVFYAPVAEVGPYFLACILCFRISPSSVVIFAGEEAAFLTSSSVENNGMLFQAGCRTS